MNHLNNDKINKEPQTQKSIRREFFNDLKEIFKKHFPNIRITDRDLSRLFFKRERALSDAHLKGDHKYRRLELSTLFSFIYKMRFLTTDEFTNSIKDVWDIDKETLNKINTEFETYIEEFIFANPFDVKYIGDKFNSGTRHLKLEYNLTFRVWFELSKAKKKPLLLKHVQKILKYETFGRLNRFGELGKGKVYSWVGLMSMLKELTKLLPGSSYSRTFDHVWKYIELRDLSPSPPGEYHSKWYNPNVIKFHVIFLIIRDLGLDILNLKPIKPEAFRKTNRIETITYERHHLFMNDKMSIDVNRLVLVMRKYHHNLEGKANLILSLIKSRLGLVLECPQYYVTNFDNWKERWQEYLARRSFLIENSIEKFINEYFTDKDGQNYIIERFFKDIHRDRIEQEIGIMMKNWINHDRSAPILNVHILKKLLRCTPNLSINGFIQYKS